MTDGLTALVIVIVGTAALGAWGVEALRSAGAARGLVAATMALAGATMLVLVVVGVREDGLLGVLYRMRHPMGTIIGGDDRPAWRSYALAWVLILACVLSGVAIARHPSAFPFWNPRGIPPAPASGTP